MTDEIAKIIAVSDTLAKRMGCVFRVEPWKVANFPNVACSSHEKIGKPMSEEQFRDALYLLELSQLGAAELFGVNARTVRRWALGEQEVPVVVVLVLRLMLKYRVKPAAAMKLRDGA